MEEISEVTMNLESVCQHLDELEESIKIARHKMQCHSRNKTVVFMAVRNVCWTSKLLEKDIMNFNPFNPIDENEELEKPTE